MILPIGFAGVLKEQIERWQTPERKTIDTYMWDQNVDIPKLREEGWEVTDIYYDSCGGITLELER